MRDGAPLACPHCPATLRPVGARARSGYVVELDQCSGCGGVWCDQWELYPISSEEALRLDPLDEGRLQARSAAATAPGRCPRCTISLQPFDDPALPPDSRIERCRVCQGMWLNRGELGRWRGRHAKPKPPTDQAIERVAAVYGTQAEWPKVQNLDAVFDPPPDPAFDTSEACKLIGSAAAWTVLRFLLRLLFRS